jgi:hypothetical protein
MFVINLPLAAVAFLAALRLIDSPLREPGSPLDRLGVALSCTGLAGAAFTAGLLSDTRPDLPAAVAVGGVSVLVLLVAVRHLLQAGTPMINLRTLRIPTFGAAVGGMSIFGLVINAVPFMLALLFQDLFGWSAVKSGSLVLFVFLGNLGIKPATSFLFSRYGFRVMLVIATAGVALTMGVAAFLTASTPIPMIGVLLILSGIARSIGGTGYTTIAFIDVPAQQMRDANTLQATVQQLSAGFGVAVGIIALQLGRHLSGLLAGSRTSAAAYTISFIVLGLLSLIATVGALRLAPDAGDILRRNRSLPGPN